MRAPSNMAANMARTTELVREHGTLTPARLAELEGWSVATARRHLEGGVERGELIADDHDEAGVALTQPHHRYMLSEEAASEDADREDYERWRESGAGALTTLQLRAAQHAADRAGEREDARKIAGEIATREAREGSS